MWEDTLRMVLKNNLEQQPLLHSVLQSPESQIFDLYSDTCSRECDDGQFLWTAIPPVLPPEYNKDRLSLFLVLPWRLGQRIHASLAAVDQVHDGSASRAGRTKRVQRGDGKVREVRPEDREVQGPRR